MQICPEMLDSRVMAVGSIINFAHLEYRFELSRRLHGTLHIQTERQDPKRQTATVKLISSKAYYSYVYKKE